MATTSWSRRMTHQYNSQTEGHTVPILAETKNHRFINITTKLRGIRFPFWLKQRIEESHQYNNQTEGHTVPILAETKNRRKSSI